jgi:hypothetical protein
VSYHLGRSQLVPGAYSARLARDRAGLSEAASALDLGHVSKPALRAFSAWLADRCRSRAIGAHDVREVIYSPDGLRVYGWSSVTPELLIPDYGDGSHLTHTHISFYRDSEHRDKLGLFAPYWAPAVPDTSTGDPATMGLHVTFLDAPTPGTLVIPEGTDAIRAADGVHYALPRTVSRDAVPCALTGPNSGPGWLVDLNGDELHFVRVGTGCVFTPRPVPAPDCSAAIADAIAADRANARITWSA